MTRTILVTGATGNVGRALTQLLTARGVAHRAMVRAPSSIATPQVVADFDDPASLDRALAGVTHAFLVTPSSPEAEARQRGFIAAARRAGVGHVVKLSQWAADAASPVRFLRYHAAAEAALRDAGLGYTLLRPNLFMQGVLGFRDVIRAHGAIFAAAGDCRISAVDVRDIAAVAAAALTEPGHAGKVYNLTGPAAVTHADMAAALSAALGRAIGFVDIPEAAMRAALGAAGMPAWQADGLIEDYAHYRRGEAAEVTGDVQAVLGRAPIGFDTFARDHAAAFA